MFADPNEVKILKQAGAKVLLRENACFSVASHKQEN
jgi:hypothetical protein